MLARRYHRPNRFAAQRPPRSCPRIPTTLRNGMAISYPRRIRHRRLSPVFGALVSTLIIVGSLLTIGGTAASAATVGTPTAILGSQSSRCVDVPNSSTTNGTQVQLFDCSAQANQSWTYTSTRQLQVFG